ncbi:MAG: hypothetical protein P1V51_04000 [Deltaproteobacteria bacterium]|nr:hypothetical protein [Deltaproteobacteria bacterium]
MRSTHLRSIVHAVLVAAVAALSLPALAAERPLPAYLDPTLDQPISARALLGGGGGDAGDKAKRFSIGLNIGLKADMANLGEAIAQDGTVDLAGSTMASTFYSTDTLVVGDRDSLAIWHNSNNTGSDFTILGAEPTLGGPLLGADLGLSAQYEFDDILGVPVYFKTGFNYVTSFSGGVQRRQLGNVLTNLTAPDGAAPTLAIPLAMAGYDPDDFDGGTLDTAFTAGWYEIPFSLGFKVPVKKQSFFYGWIGASYFSGGFDVHLQLDEQYVNAVTTHVDTEQANPADMVTPGAAWSAEGLDEVVSFRASTFGLNYGLGGQIDLGFGLVWYAELNSSGAAKTVYSNDLSDHAAETLTRLSSSTLGAVGEASGDWWFKRLAFPVVMGGGSLRTGLRYYIF